MKLLKDISDRERAPMYIIGGRNRWLMQFTFENSETGEKPIDWQLGEYVLAALQKLFWKI